MSDNILTQRWTARYLEPWEMVDHFKVNKWMRSLGATWKPKIENRKKSGFTKDYWILDGMRISQKNAAKWYLAAHKKKWWKFL